MRPKKKILVYSPDENELSCFAYLLRIWRFDPVTASTERKALTAVADTVPRYFDGAVVMGRSGPGIAGNLVKELARADPDLRIALFVSALDPEMHCLPALVQANRTGFEMIEAVRIMVARKRGPKAKEPRGYVASALKRVG